MVLVHNADLMDSATQTQKHTQEDAEYLREHKVTEALESLLRAILQSRPLDPSHLINEAIHSVRNAATAKPHPKTTSQFTTTTPALHSNPPPLSNRFPSLEPIVPPTPTSPQHTAMSSEGITSQSTSQTHSPHLMPPSPSATRLRSPSPRLEGRFPVEAAEHCPLMFLTPSIGQIERVRDGLECSIHPSCRLVSPSGSPAGEVGGLTTPREIIKAMDECGVLTPMLEDCRHCPMCRSITRIGWQCRCSDDLRSNSSLDSGNEEGECVTKDSLLELAYSYRLNANDLDLTDDDIAALYLYCSEVGLGVAMNQAVREEEAKSRDVFLAYFDCLERALVKLPKLEKSVLYRGTNMSINPQHYTIGHIISWGGMSSCTASARGAQRFLDTADEVGPCARTGSMFVVETETSRDVSGFSSWYTDVKGAEIVLQPNTLLRVRRVNAKEGSAPTTSTAGRLLSAAMGVNLKDVDVFELREVNLVTCGGVLQALSDAERAALGELVSLLEDNANVNAKRDPCIRDGNGATPLHIAVGQAHHYPQVVHLLCVAGFPTEVANAAGRYPLHLLLHLPCGAHTADVMHSLVVHGGADVNRAAQDGVPPIITAVQANDSRLLQYLLAYKPDVNSVVGDREAATTPLLEAVKSDNDAEGKTAALLKAGADPNLNAFLPANTPMTHAVKRCSLAIVNLLLGAGASPNPVAGQSMLAFSMNIVRLRCANPAIVEALRNAGAKLLEGECDRTLRTGHHQTCVELLGVDESEVPLFALAGMNGRFAVWRPKLDFAPTEQSNDAMGGEIMERSPTTVTTAGHVPQMQPRKRQQGGVEYDEFLLPSPSPAKNSLGGIGSSVVSTSGLGPRSALFGDSIRLGEHQAQRMACAGCENEVDFDGEFLSSFKPPLDERVCVTALAVHSGAVYGATSDNFLCKWSAEMEGQWKVPTPPILCLAVSNQHVFCGLEDGLGVWCTTEGSRGFVQGAGERGFVALAVGGTGEVFGAGSSVTRWVLRERRQQEYDSCWSAAWVSSNNDEATSIVHMPAFHVVVVGMSSGALVVVCAGTGLVRSTVEPWVSASVTCLLLHKIPNENGTPEDRLFVGSSDGVISVWDPTPFVAPGPAGSLPCAQGEVLHVPTKYTGDADKNEPFCWRGCFTGHRGDVKTIHVCRNFLWTSSSDCTVRRWDLNNMNRRRTGSLVVRNAMPHPVWARLKYYDPRPQQHNSTSRFGCFRYAEWRQPAMSESRLQIGHTHPLCICWQLQDDDEPLNWEPQYATPVAFKAPVVTLTESKIKFGHGGKLRLINHTARSVRFRIRMAEGGQWIGNTMPAAPRSLDYPVWGTPVEVVWNYADNEDSNGCASCGVVQLCTNPAVCTTKEENPNQDQTAQVSDTWVVRFGAPRTARAGDQPQRLPMPTSLSSTPMHDWNPSGGGVAAPRQRTLEGTRPSATTLATQMHPAGDRMNGLPSGGAQHGAESSVASFVPPAVCSQPTQLPCGDLKEQHLHQEAQAREGARKNLEEVARHAGEIRLD